MRKTVFALVAAVLLGLSTAPASAANPDSGKRVFDVNCASCHGDDGNAVVPGAPSFALGERLEKPDRMLLGTIQNGLNLMPAWQGLLSPTDAADALAYIRTLSR